MAPEYDVTLSGTLPPIRVESDDASTAFDAAMQHAPDGFLPTGSSVVGVHEDERDDEIDGAADEPTA